MPRRASPKAKKRLCKRGYETAKRKFESYPSAYANAYAVQVCRGEKPDSRGRTFASEGYKGRSKRASTGLERWFAEKWVNVCKWPKGKHEFPPPFPSCGRGRAKDENGRARRGAYPEKGRARRGAYPYCRPTVRVSKQTPKTVKEIGEKRLKEMCKKKQRVGATKRINV